MFMAYTQSEHLWDARTTLTARHGGPLMLTMSIRMSTPGKQDFIRPAPRPSAVPCGGITDFLGSGADHRVPQHFPLARMERKRHIRGRPPPHRTPSFMLRDRGCG